MSLRKKIICGILMTLVVCLGVAVAFLYDDIAVVLSGLRYSVDELEVQIEQNDQTIKNVAQVVPNIAIRDLSDEDKQSLKDGTITKEELAESLISAVLPPKQEEIPNQESSKLENPEAGQASYPDQSIDPALQNQKERDLEIAKIVAETYVLREEFLQKLDGLMARAMADYKALKPAERKSSKLVTMVSDYLATGLTMEKECDAEIKKIIARLETALRESGRDLSLAETVFDTYLEEKSLKKSWYMAQLKERGLI